MSELPGMAHRKGPDGTDSQVTSTQGGVPQLPDPVWAKPWGCGPPSTGDPFTFRHLRVKFLRRGCGVECPGDVVLREVVGAVASVPGVLAVGPGQLGGEGGEEVVECPGHDGVVVEGGVKGNDAGGVTNPWDRG